MHVCCTQCNVTSNPRHLSVFGSKLYIISVLEMEYKNFSN